MTVNELHNTALDLADDAFSLRRKGKSDESIIFFAEAYKYEIKAAHLCMTFPNNEPTKSILLRSAASLAKNASLLDEARKAIHLALAGDPPQSICSELYDLLDEVTFIKHLSTEGVSLIGDEVQVSLSGPSVDKGIVKYNEVNSRVEIITKLVTRTAERMQGRDFRTTGRSAALANYQPYMSTARAQSYAFTLRFAKPLNGQIPLSGFEASNVLPNLFEKVKSIENKNITDIKKSMNNNYFDNFISLAKQLAPDGNNISTVGFSYKSNNEIVDIPFRITKSEINNLVYIHDSKIDQSESISLTGKLSHADSNKGILKLSPISSKTTYDIKISKALDDVVKIYWGDIVDVRLVRRKGSKSLYSLLEISQA